MRPHANPGSPGGRHRAPGRPGAVGPGYDPTYLISGLLALGLGAVFRSAAGAIADPGAHQFSPWAGFTVFTAYAAAAPAAGLVLFLRRDA